MKVLDDSQDRFTNFTPNPGHEQDREAYLFLMRLSKREDLAAEQRDLLSKLVSYYSKVALLEE